FTRATLAWALAAGAAIVLTRGLLPSAYRLASIPFSTAGYHFQPFFLLALGPALLREPPTLGPLAWSPRACGGRRLWPRTGPAQRAGRIGAGRRLSAWPGAGPGRRRAVRRDFHHRQAPQAHRPPRAGAGAGQPGRGPAAAHGGLRRPASGSVTMGLPGGHRPAAYQPDLYPAVLGHPETADYVGRGPGLHLPRGRHRARLRGVRPAPGLVAGGRGQPDPAGGRRGQPELAPAGARRPPCTAGCGSGRRLTAGKAPLARRGLHRPGAGNRYHGRLNRRPPRTAHSRTCAMIDLYYWTTPNGHKITMFLEEAGLPYRIHPVNISKGDQFKP